MDISRWGSKIEQILAIPPAKKTSPPKDIDDLINRKVTEFEVEETAKHIQTAVQNHLNRTTLSRSMHCRLLAAVAFDNAYDGYMVDVQLITNTGIWQASQLVPEEAVVRYATSTNRWNTYMASWMNELDGKISGLAFQAGIADPPVGNKFMGITATTNSISWGGPNPPLNSISLPSIPANPRPLTVGDVSLEPGTGITRVWNGEVWILGIDPANPEPSPDEIAEAMKSISDAVRSAESAGQ